MARASCHTRAQPRIKFLIYIYFYETPFFQHTIIKRKNTCSKRRAYTSSTDSPIFSKIFSHFFPPFAACHAFCPSPSSAPRIVWRTNPNPPSSNPYTCRPCAARVCVCVCVSGPAAVAQVTRPAEQTRQNLARCVTCRRPVTQPVVAPSGLLYFHCSAKAFGLSSRTLRLRVAAPLPLALSASPIGHARDPTRSARRRRRRADTIRTAVPRSHEDTNN